MKLSNLIYEGEYISRLDAQKTEVSNITTDSRKVRNGSVFVCLRGASFDSHACIEEALRRGATAVIAERHAPISAPKDAPIFLVESTHRALAFMCSRYYGSPERYMKIIGVTGTNGKSTTVSLISDILRNAGIKTGVIGTIDTQIDGKSLDIWGDEDELQELKSMTTPSPLMLYRILAEMRAHCVQYVIMEVSSHSLYYEKCAPISFYISVFTNLSPEHLDFHTDMISYAQCKARLLAGARHSIINADTDYSHLMLRSATGHALLVSASGKADITCSDIISHADLGSEFIYESKGLKFPIRISSPGLFSVQNAVMACAVCECIGISPIIIKDALENSVGVRGRLERVHTPNASADFSVFIDYAHTPAAMENLLKTVDGFCKEGQRKVVLFGCGGDRDRGKRAPMGRIAAEHADHLIITSDNPRSEDRGAIISDIIAGIPKDTSMTVIENRADAIRFAIENARKGDIILLVGKGHESYEIGADGYRPFSEHDIVRETLLSLSEK